MKQQLPPNVIDIEASGFGVTSYPIEIGIVLSSGKKYCSLIQQAPGWTYWSVEAGVFQDSFRLNYLSRFISPVRI
ncbi:hypothetical protein [Bathymodiolus japonicus methanotrophic gill symbiont]|uniref:hypothetical protein n=1 Tax=Bathymodiolus japonicus methanotrophic gill symbiont TaxID=113269 RepID=UPI001C8D2EEA|nr:hypothetical protein [Bathymodiolus japonicus methanotrophic gill symbiont]